MNDTGKGIEDSVNDIMDQIILSVQNLDTISKCLLTMVGDDSKDTSQLVKYIELLQFNLTGNYSWS